MKEKILIVASLWPPNASTGMYRTVGFVESLSKFGYYPVLVTQNWDHTKTGQLYNREVFDNYEVYKINTGESGTKKINKYLTRKNWPFIRKAYNLFDKLCWNLGIWSFQEYKKMLRVSKEIISKDKTIRKAIVISDPFQLYFIGYILHRKYGVKWIADYRDAWNTMEFSDSFKHESNKLSVYLKKLEARTEKKWVGTSSFVTGVSDHYVKRISEFVHVAPETIYNGFFTEELLQFSRQETTGGKFTILYNGTLYPGQQIEIFLEGFKHFINSQTGIKAEIRFIGLKTFPEAEEKINDLLKGFKQYYTVTDRVPKEELIKEINRSDLLLIVTQGPQYKGVATSKIFDYLASSKPVICCPSDKDVVMHLLTESGQGFFADTPEEVTQLLELMYREIIGTGAIKFNLNRDAILQYTRENQTKRMAALLDKM